MEDTPRDQETKGKSNKSTGREDGGPSSGTTAYISSVNNSSVMTLIKYEIDESIEIKEEILETKSEWSKSTGRQDAGPSSCATTNISSVNNFGARALIGYDFDESLYIKQEIFQDELHQQGKLNLSGQNQLNEKCLTTLISSDNNSDAKTLGEHNFFEVLDIKEEVLEDEDHQWGKGNFQLNEKSLSTEISSNNDYDQTLQIKEETIQDQENTYQEPDENESKFCPVDTREAIMTVQNPQISKKKKLNDSDAELKKKYSCEKCARRYVRREGLYKHKKFECGAMPQFSCQFCGKRFKQKSVMTRHVDSVHLKTNLKSSQTMHNCIKCSRSYRYAKSLNRHKRLEHAEVSPQFVCDFCGFQAKRKDNLSQHITSRHLQKMQVSIAETENKYKCEKCARSYTQKRFLDRHQQLQCDVMPQFRCNYCGKKFKQKGNMNTHILRVHEKTRKASETRHNCDKCSGSYSSADSLYQHKRLEHSAVRPQFICDYCSHKTKRKACLSRHIISQHLNL